MPVAEAAESDISDPAHIGWAGATVAVTDGIGFTVTVWVGYGIEHPETEKV